MNSIKKLYLTITLALVTISTTRTAPFTYAEKLWFNSAIIYARKNDMLTLLNQNIPAGLTPATRGLSGDIENIDTQFFINPIVRVGAFALIRPELRQAFLEAIFTIFFKL